MRRWMAPALATAMLVASCAKVEGEKFACHWVNVASQDDTMDIERNDESFMVRITTLEFFSRKPKTENYPAIYRGGVLQVTNNGETVNFAIDQASGHLRTGSDA